MTTHATHGPDSQAARFRFKSKGLEVEFEGEDSFLSAQIEHLKPALERELKRLADEAAQQAPAAAEGESAAPAEQGGSSAGPSLEDFYRRAKSREGRGALQEMILIFAYFLREYRGKEEFGIE